MNHTAEDLFAMAPVIPVITVDNLDTAIPLANALVKGGLPVLEITLRTPQGLEAIGLIKNALPNAIVGAGTVLNAADLGKALDAGAEFVITPGLTPELLQAGTLCGVPFMPGIATVSEMMRCIEAGLSALKFFPAEACGGAKTLKAFSGPFPTISFCPTGGVSPDNLAGYLQVPSVKTVGGSWMTPKHSVENGDWAEITRLASEGCELVASIRQKQKQ